MFDQVSVREPQPPRLNETSLVDVCDYCSGPITVGEYEATGICSKCYWEAVIRYLDEEGDFE